MYLLYQTFIFSSTSFFQFFTFFSRSNKNLGRLDYDKLNGNRIAYGIKDKGWYRIAEYTRKGINNDGIRGAENYSCILAIKSNYGTGGNQSAFVVLNCAYLRSDFTILGQQAYGYNISMIRHTIDISSDDKKAFIEVYYENSFENRFSFEIISIQSSTNEKWILYDTPISTQESISNINIMSQVNLIKKDKLVVTNSDMPQFYFGSIDIPTTTNFNGEYQGAISSEEIKRQIIGTVPNGKQALIISTYGNLVGDGSILAKCATDQVFLTFSASHEGTYKIFVNIIVK